MFKMTLFLPDEIEAEARTRLELIRNRHREVKDRDLTLLSNKIKVTSEDATLYMLAAREREKRVTIQNLIKTLVRLGLQEPRFTNDMLLDDMAATGLPMGRPVVAPVRKGRRLRVVASKR